MRPLLIYQSLISANDSIETLIFPGRDEPSSHRMGAMVTHARRDVTAETWLAIAAALGHTPGGKTTAQDKKFLQDAVDFIESQRAAGHPNATLCDLFARTWYGPQISQESMLSLPDELRAAVADAMSG